MTTTDAGATRDAIQFHYDLSNEFYALWLDRRMVYSCAMWGDDDDLEAAQVRKLDHHVASSGAAGGHRVLDVGCGWGSLLERLATVHGVAEPVGLTLSEAQAEQVRGGWSADVRVESWAEHPATERYDAVISIGAFEHFARPGMTRADRVAQYREFFKRCGGWLGRGSGLSIQSITKGSSVRLSRQTRDDMAFVMERIFPESELPWLSEIIEASERRFRLVAVHNDGDHYARTAREWLRRLRDRSDEARLLVGDERLAEYERYLDRFGNQFSDGHVELVRLALRRV